jgi:hypothetical protein
VSYNNKLNNNIFFWYIVLFTILYSGFRIKMGTDYETYVMYYVYPEMFYDEPVFKAIFIDFLRFFSKEYWLFFFVTSSVINIGFAYSIYFYSENRYMSLMLYLLLLYLSSFNLVAQFIVLSVLSVYINKYFDGNRVKYIIFVLMMTGLHYFSLWLILLLLIKNKNSYVVLCCLWVVSVFMLLYNSYNTALGEGLIRYFESYIYKGDLFYSYLRSAEYYFKDDNSNIRIYLRNIIFVILFWSLVLKKWKGEFMINNQNEKLLGLSLVGLIGGNIFSFTSQIGPRLSMITDVSFIFLVPSFIGLYNGIMKYLISFIVVSYFCVESYYRFVLLKESGVF